MTCNTISKASLGSGYREESLARCEIIWNPEFSNISNSLTAHYAFSCNYFDGITNQ